ncbi:MULTISPECIES: SRPBCC family protein [Pseudoalteromonas]|uniref:SRPBCC family protein n=1 Tax=Pseudoalteromonas rubra TaxID=43658 RepID=A0A5S3UVA7_9GAMM|nr:MULTISPECIES: SRPBCC family protein [Pseudoalteromonas]MCG7564283.1 SRPBCC family protein [Pseudoalteromonas sp. McH1-42]QPB84230.1 SRPBCC family protein [Pseudoalteromonas rubra]
MVNVRCHRDIAATPHEVMETLLDHPRLDRFFNAQFKVVHSAVHPAIRGGSGCIREVRMLGLRFYEQIQHADPGSIRYQIVGDFPVKKHQGEIRLRQIDNNTSTRIDYHVRFAPPWYLPGFIIRHLITRDINLALTRLEASYAVR